MNKVWICAIAKMEERYIREWVEWHKKIGIDHIVLGDNNDSDYDKPLQPIIQDYVDEGFVEIINVNDKLGYQRDFYNNTYKERKDEFDWIGFIDIDEFVELKANNDIHDFLNQSKFTNFNSILFCWLCYGDSEHLYYEDKPVKQRFNRLEKSRPNYVGIKFFIRGKIDGINRLSSIHNPELGKFEDGFQIKVCDVLGNRNFKRFINKEKGPKHYTRIHYDFRYYQTAYLSHYITKSTEEYIQYKILRGRCDRNVNDYDIRYTQRFYFNHNNKSKIKQQLFNKYLKDINQSTEEQLKKYNMIK